MYLKKYRFHARKVEDSEHAIYDVCERVRCSLTESRPPAVRRPAPSQIKMYGFCRLFRAMFHAWGNTGDDLARYVGRVRGTLDVLVQPRQVDGDPGLG